MKKEKSMFKFCNKNKRQYKHRTNTFEQPLSRLKQEAPPSATPSPPRPSSPETSAAASSAPLSPTPSPPKTNTTHNNIRKTKPFDHTLSRFKLEPEYLH